MSIYADVSADDSYTPQKISFRAGTHHADLAELSHVELIQPMGWQHFRLAGDPSPDGTEPSVSLRLEQGELCGGGVDREAGELTSREMWVGVRREPVKAHLLQIAILTNHLNGKDTHIRGLRVFAPRE